MDDLREDNVVTSRDSGYSVRRGRGVGFLKAKDTLPGGIMDGSSLTRIVSASSR